VVVVVVVHLWQQLQQLDRPYDWHVFDQEEHRFLHLSLLLSFSSLSVVV
jgi:hypothetical protein